MVTSILVILIPVIYLALKTPREAAAAWWSNDWSYRVKAIISNAGSEQTDFQVSITLDTATAIAAEKMQDDCDDIRITDITGSLISDPYWVGDCDDTNTKIWIKFATVPTTDQVYYVYYGNSSAGSRASSGNDVFEFFDDFSGSSIDSTKWDIVNSGTGSEVVSDGTLSITSSGDWWDTSDTSRILLSKTAITSDYVAEVKVNDSGSANYNRFFGLRASTAANSRNVALIEDSDQSHLTTSYRTTDGATSTYQGNDIASFSEPHIAKWVREGTTLKGYTDSTLVNTITSISNLDYVALTSTGGGTTVFDYILIHKFASTEPASANASEETGPGPIGWWKFDEQVELTTISTPVTNIEQQINITNQYFVKLGQTPSPADSSLGVIHWDADKYPGATVYLEANIRTSNGTQYARAQLYTVAGAATSNSVTTYSTSFARTRSSALTLTDDTDYTVRLWSQNVAATSYLKGARLIIIQADGTKITDTETQIELGDAQNIGSTSPTQLTDKKIYYYDSTQFSPTPTAYFEASLRNSQPTIEQQINIVDQYYTNLGQTPSPTDNSLGVIRWDADKYPGATVYLETDFRTSNNSQYARAQLYTAAGVAASNSVTTYSTSFVRERSAALTLVDDTDYTIRIWNQNAAVTTYLNSARLIIIQTDGTKITDTSTQIELGNYETSFTNTAYASLTDTKLYQYDQDLFSPTPESSADVEFHATLSIDDNTDTVYAELYNKTNSTSVAIISTTSPSPVLVIGANVDGDSDWDTTNDDEYEVRIRCSDDGGGGCSGNIYNAKIVLDQTAAGGITDVEILHQQVNSLVTDADSTYTSQNRTTYYNPGLITTQTSFGGANLTFFYETTMKTSAGTGYAQLYNATDSSAISNSEVSTTSATYERKTSADITSDLPEFPQQTGAKNTDTQIKNAATNTTSVSNSWLKVQVSNLATAGVTAYADLYNLTDSTQVSGSEVSTSSASWDRQRSSAITLTTGKEYVVRIKSSATNVNVSLANAKIVLDQTDSTNGISLVEVIHQQINTLATDADTGYTEQLFRNRYDTTTLGFPNAVYYEATMKTSAGTGYADLWDDTGAATITNSELSTTSTSYERQRSSNISANMPSTASDMDTRIKNDAADTTSVASSWLVLQLGKIITRPTYDSSTNDNYGDISSGVERKSEEFCANNGPCLYLDGSDDVITVANAVVLDFDSVLAAGSTFQAWVKINSDGENDQGEIFDKGTGTYMRVTDDGTLEVSIDLATTNATTSASITLDEWHHVAMGYTDDSDDEISLYVDGVLRSTSTNGEGAPSSDTNDFLIGGDSSNNFHGFIDEVKIYGYERTGTEIKTDAVGSTGTSGSQSVQGAKDYSFANEGLVAYFDMNETAADSCSGGTNDSCDSSGKDNDAAWGGNTTFATGKFGNSITLDGTTDSADLSATTGIPGKVSWYSDSWAKRRPITVTNNVGVGLTDYQVNLTITYDSDMQADFDDLRFANSTGTLLDHWTQSKTDSTTANVWVEVDQMQPSTDTTIYMYYGNSSASSSSDGDTTFDFFDDFPGSAVDSGVWGTSGTVTVADSVVTIDGTGSLSKLYTLNSFGLGEPYILESKYQHPSSNRNRIALTTTSGGGRPTSYDYGIFSGQVYWNAWTGVAMANDTWFLLKWIETASDYTFQVYNYEGSQKITRSHGSDIANVDYVSFWGTETDSDMKLDWVRARQYATTEPSTSTGTEQVGGISTTMTLSAWVYADTLDAAQRNIFARDASPNYEFYIGNSAASAGKLIYTTDNDSTTQTSTATLATGSWYHVALAVDKTITKLYINGAYDSEVTNTEAVSDVGGVSIGAADDGTASWAGDIDEVRIYNRTLSEREISQLYNWTPPSVSYYPMDENTGTTTTYDKSGNGYSGTLTSITEDSWTKGKFGSALELDGSADFIDIGVGHNQVNSVAFWVYPETTTEPFINLTGTSDYISTSSGTVSATGFTSPTIYVNGIESSTIVAGAWQHIVVTTATSEDASNFEIGRTADANYLEGKIDEVRLYDYVLTSGEIIEVMNAGHPIGGSPIASQTVYYALDELSGTTANDTASLTSTNGTITGSTWIQEANCKINSCLELDGTDDVITVTNNDEIDFDTGLNNGFTFSSWIYADSDGEANVGEILDKGTNTYLRVDNESGGSLDVEGKLDLATTDATLNISAAININEWNHIAMSYTDDSDDEITIWINGVNVGSSADGEGSLATDTNNLLIGGDAGANFDGKIDEFKIYSTELTEPELKGDMNAGSSAAFGGVLGTSERSNLGLGDTGPVGYWQMDENTGTTDTYDKSGNNNNGTLTSITESSWVPGKYGSALSFDGSADYAVLPAVAVGGDTGSLSAWFKMNSALGSGTYASILSRDYSRSTLEIENDGGSVIAVFRIDNGHCASYLAGDLISADTWYHLVGTYDGINKRIYLNGRLIKTCATTGNWGAEASSWSIGNYDGDDPGSKYFDGIIDEVKIFTDTLTNAQVIYDYNRGAPIGHWQFDSCSGTTAYDASVDANGDPNANNGTWSGATGTNTTTGTCDSGAGDEAWDNGTTGKINYSLDFDGTDDIVTITNASETDFDEALQNGMTWSTWIYTNSDGEANQGEIFEKGTGTFCRTDNESGSNLDLQCELDLVTTTATLNVSAALTLNTWHHIVMGYTDDSDDEITLYVDGINVGSSTNGDGAPQTPDTNNIVIGGDSSNNFDGQIDDFRLYNYELTRTQILNVMNNGAQNFN